MELVLVYLICSLAMEDKVCLVYFQLVWQQKRLEKQLVLWKITKPAINESLPNRTFKLQKCSIFYIECFDDVHEMKISMELMLLVVQMEGWLEEDNQCLKKFTNQRPYIMHDTESLQYRWHKKGTTILTK